MAKPRVSLEVLTAEGQGAVPAPQEAPAIASAVEQPTARVVELVQHTSAEKPRAMRKDKPHTTLYLGKRARKVVKEIALHFDTTPQALYLEGIDMMLAKYGRPTLKDLAD